MACAPYNTNLLTRLAASTFICPSTLGFLTMCLLAPCAAVAQVVTLKATARVIATSEDGAFDAARWVQPLPDGSLIIPNSSEMALELWSRAGTRITRWGRKGEGPGEFRTLREGGTAGEGIWVADAAQQRTTFYGPSGVLRATVRWPAIVRHATESVSPAGRVALSPRAWLDTNEFLGLAIPVAAGTDGTTIIRLARASVQGGIEKEHVLPTQPAPTGRCAQVSPRVVVLRCPLARHAFSTDGGRFAWVTQSAMDDARGWYRLEVRDAQGSILNTDSVAVTRRLISAAERDRLTRSVATAVRRAGVARSAEPTVAEPPRFSLSVDEVWVATDGTTWIQLPGKGDTEVAFHRHVVGRRGFGRWTAPTDFVVLWAGSTSVIGRHVNEAGVTVLVEYTVVP
jgi:hypothetical protein